MGLDQSLWIGTDGDPDCDDIAIGEAVSRSARLWPDVEAAVFACQQNIDEVRWTFAELDALSTRLARALLDLGHSPGDRIAIWAPNHPNWILLEYAIAKAGMVIVAINPLYRESELTYALNASDVTTIFHAVSVGGVSMATTIDAVRGDTPSLRNIYDLTIDLDRLLSGAASDAQLPAVAPHDLFMIQYTSGTTGVPKAAWLPHGAIATISARTYRRWDFGPGDRVCHGFPMFHVGGSGNSTPGSLIVGTTTLPIHIFRAGEALDILEQERCTGFIGVPSMLTAMMEDDSLGTRDLSALKRIVVGGAAVPSPFLRQCEDTFGVEMLNGYGQTESCGVSASVRPGDDASKKTGTSGLALPGVSLKVVDAEGRIQPCGVPGELCADGPGKMIGYGDPQATREAFDAEGWLRTGDIATMDGDGYVTIVGRLKDMIIRGGENLYPAEIEAYLIEHPDIAEAAVIGLPDEKYGEELCAVLRPASPDHEDANTILEWCRKRVSRWKVPRYIAFVDAMPTTASGKIIKHELLPLMAEQFGLPTDQPNGAET
ncbi:class I adenylate-forming enzyme family protein [Parasphingopyxis marina]|uniref:3-methylmercaptopropionyl-CoA ligase n=1 Tax=Parasphingopyxis marina TaxID=2761622 RepID=A0A842I2A1_9SPHN|nr:AMP-binding protein [Parasphingopyxis marina]MBC2778961.1 AMP-binding protein [Parasphingopyxis marina]